MLEFAKKVAQGQRASSTMVEVVYEQIKNATSRIFCVLLSFLGSIAIFDSLD